MANINHPEKQKEEEDRINIRMLAKRDLITFGQLMLPDDFMKSKPAPFHYEASKVWLDKGIKRRCFILPRGHSKSTLAKAGILYDILYNEPGKNEFVAWVSEEQSQAIDHIKYIQNHLEENPRILHYYGDLVGKKRKWTEKEFITTKGDRIIAKGTSQRLRGRSQLGLRYTNIVLDDFESELNTKTPDRRREIKEWVMSTVDPALSNEKGSEGILNLVGTIVHYDSFLQNIYEGYLEAEKDGVEYAWKMVYHKAIEDGKALWPDYFSLAKLREIRARYESIGLPHKFAQEYLNEARDPDTALFKIEKLQYYSGEFVERGGFAYLKIKDNYIPINVYIGVDMAYEASKGHDYQVIMVTGIDHSGNVYILDKVRERFPLYELPGRILKIAKEYQPIKRVNIEKVGAQGLVREHIMHMTAKDRSMVPLITKGVRPPTGISKEDRIEAHLCPIVNSGKLFLREAVDSEILDEMFQFPKSKHDDCMDAIWYAIFKAQRPRSHSLTVDEFSKRAIKHKNKTKLRSWITGLPEN